MIQEGIRLHRQRGIFVCVPPQRHRLHLDLFRVQVPLTLPNRWNATCPCQLELREKTALLCLTCGYPKRMQMMDTPSDYLLLCELSLKCVKCMTKKLLIFLTSFIICFNNEVEFFSSHVYFDLPLFFNVIKFELNIKIKSEY